MNDQAKLKALWEDLRIASICALMPNFALLGKYVETHPLVRTSRFAYDDPIGY